MTPEQLDLSPEAQAQQLANRATLPPTRIYLIRHGEPNPADLNRYYGQLDVELGERGQRQSRQLADRLAQVPFDAIYASDLVRAGYLADLLAATRDLPVRRLTVFRERHMGVMQGYTPEELEQRFPEKFTAWRADRVNYRVDEAENFIDLQERIVPAVMELVMAFPGKRIAVVCHAGPIRVAVAHALGLPLDHIFRIAVNHCGLFVLEFPMDAAPRVTLLNG